MRATASLLALAMLTTPVVVQAEEPASADPFKPVQPAWPSNWNESKPPKDKAQKPAPAPADEEPKPSAQAEDNEVFTFDSESPAQEAGEQAEETEVEEDEAKIPSASAPIAEEKPAASAKPVAEIDLKTPNTLIVVGAAIIGVAAVAGLVAGIAMDEPGLAALSFGGGSALGLGVMTTGVVIRNDRLEAEGHDVAPAVAHGLTLKLKMAH